MPGKQSFVAGRNTKVADRLTVAATYLRAGRNREAEAACNDVLLFEPENADALQMLCALSLQAGEIAQALDYALRAAAVVPRSARVQLLLGRIHRARDDSSAAIEAFERATRLDARSVEAWISLGVALRSLDPTRALDCHERARRLDPRNALACVNAANVQIDLGQTDQAESSLRRAIALGPSWSQPYFHLGKLLHNVGRTDEAAAELRKALEADPYFAEAALHLGSIERSAGRLQSALVLFLRAASAAPRHAKAHLMVATAYRDLDNYERALAAYRQCIEIDPDAALAWNDLSVLYQLDGRLDEALIHARRAIEIDPNYPEARASLAGALAVGGDSEEAGRVYESMRIDGEIPPVIATNYLNNLNYVDTVQPSTLVSRHRTIVSRAFGLGLEVAAHSNIPDPERPLRIGYVSADFRRHSVAYFIEPVIASHDRSQFHVTCYYNRIVVDEVSERIRRSADSWVPCERWSDEDLVQRIRRDDIDVLVDLSGHTEGNRLAVFARKPSPLQLTWLGYPTTSGLPTMDYRITDAIVDPPGSDAWSTETLLRMPHSYYCYRPFERAPDITLSPSGSGRPITFGSFNSLAKVGTATLDLWAAVLGAVPGSLLVVKAKGLTDDGVRSRLLEKLRGRGIDAGRVTVRGWEKQHGAQLSVYAEVDIALDTFPYNGGTTTCETLWMGVPVVTLAGSTHASRMGASLLGAAGLPEWVAVSPEEYVRIAVGLARDRKRLADLRQGMRDRLRRSPLMDEVRFTRNLESMYREIWRKWCLELRQA